MNDDYIEPWRQQAVSLGGIAPAPQNGHLIQLKPRRNRRNPALDEAISRARAKDRDRLPSGHSLVRHNQQARWISGPTRRTP